MGTIKTMPCLRATSCISFTVGPSGIFSTASYQRGSCSAQKYGVVKTSCMQRIWTPCLAASSMKLTFFSMFDCLILSIASSIEHALDACINPHLTTLDIVTPLQVLGVRG